MDACREATVTHRPRKRNRTVGLLLAASALLFAPGLLLPAIAVERFWLGIEYSILDGIAALVSGGDWFLAAVVGLFSVLLPTLKLGLAAWVWIARRPPGRVVEFLGTVSRYSMIDVFVIALTVMVIDGRILTSAAIGPGIVCFALSVALSTWACRRIQ